MVGRKLAARKQVHMTLQAVSRQAVDLFAFDQEPTERTPSWWRREQL